MNGIQLTVAGNLTRDPEAVTLNSGTSLCKFSIAVERSWKNDATGEWDKATSFLNVVCWRYVAEDALRLLEKGVRVVVSGRLDEETWDDKDTGAKRSKFVLTADEIALGLKNIASFERKQYEARDGGAGRPAMAGASARPTASRATASDSIWGDD